MLGEIKMKIKITKKVELERVDNNMTSYLKLHVFFKILNDEKTYSRHGHFVATVFDDDIFELLEKERITIAEQKQAINEILINIIESYIFDFNKPEALIEMCNASIKEWNSRKRGFIYGD